LRARPSWARRRLADQTFAFNVAKALQPAAFLAATGQEGTIEGGVVGFTVLEMTALEQLAARILSEAAEVPAANKIRRGDMTEGEFRRFVEARQIARGLRAFSSTTQPPCRSASLPPVHGV